MAAEVRDREVGDVRQEQRDVLSASDAELRKGAREALGVLVHSLVGELGLSQNDGRLGRVTLGALAQNSGKIQAHLTLCPEPDVTPELGRMKMPRGRPRKEFAPQLWRIQRAMPQRSPLGPRGTSATLKP